MATGTNYEFECVYLNPDGSLVCGFKAEADAPAFLVDERGSIIPREFVWGW